VRFVAVSAVTLIALAGWITPGYALPLDEVVCKAAADQLTAIEAEGVKEQMLKGPEWAIANLPADKVARIEKCPSLVAAVQPDPNEGDDIYGPPVPAELKKPTVPAKKPAAKVGKAGKKPRKSAFNDAYVPPSPVKAVQ
jgi:hypothetical protein